MSRYRLTCAAALAPLLLATACGTLPGAGPSPGALKAAPDVDVVSVTPAMAEAMAAKEARAQADAVAHALDALGTTTTPPAFTFGPGAAMTLTLWSFSPKPGAEDGPQPTALGSHTVAADGTILLPYAGQVRLAGLTLGQAQAALTRRFEALGLFYKPSIAIDVGAVPQGSVLVTGAVGAPKSLAWPPQGLTLGEALTQALGDGNSLFGEGDATTTSATATRVAVLRGDRTVAELPIAAALEQKIPLRPDDRILVRKSPAVQVAVLGAGIQGNSVQRFAEVPTLTQVLGRAAGLNANSANDHAVFVLRRREGEKPVLYDFAWNKAQGVVAANSFPVENGDLVYVAEAPIISVQRVINILFQVALPAQVFK
ncbi:MAG TPA: polysaccharide biosynthesis/export family protein [Sphingomonadaceae bacterium]|nr:polysaccharide biosynthesis/export family protein [Sphingomonadaceae bacterium]